MTARASLRLINLDAHAIDDLPEQVQQAAEILAAYVAGLDQGLHQARRAERAEAPLLGETPPTDPADLPNQGAAGRAELEDRAAGRLATEQATVSADDLANSICGILSEIDVPQDDEDHSDSTEIVLVWGADCYRRLSGLSR